MEQLPASQNEAIPERTTPNRRLLIVAAGAVALLLVAAAFVAGRLLRKEPTETGGGSGMGMMIEEDGPGGGRRSVKIDLQPAEELPETEPDARGVFVRREDNSLFIGTGRVTLAVEKSDNASPAEVASSYDGPVVEVVLVQDTLIYKDVTNEGMEMPEPGSGATEMKVQQRVAAGTLDEIGENSAVTVWGRKTGDRLIADVLVYSQPMITKMK